MNRDHEERTRAEEALRRDLEALREARVSEAFEPRLRVALRQAERGILPDDGRAEIEARRARVSWAMFAVLAQATVAFGFMLHLSINGAREPEAITHEVLSVQIPEGGHAIWVPLRLGERATGVNAVLKVEAPEGVDVRAHDTEHAGSEAVCDGSRCAHSVVVPDDVGADEAHVRVGIRAPGTYEIEVAPLHGSDEGRARRFVVRATH